MAFSFSLSIITPISFNEKPNILQGNSRYSKNKRTKNTPNRPQIRIYEVVRYGQCGFLFKAGVHKIILVSKYI